MGGYRIRAVAKMTGMSPALLRAWEARYGLVTPERTEAGYRLYSDEDVALFIGAQRLVRQGLAPMQVSRLPRNKLLEAGGASLHGSHGSPGSSPLSDPVSPRSYHELIERVITAVTNFDVDRANELLALPLLLMPPDIACRKFLVPLLTEIGERWHRRELSVAAEHFGTALVRNKLVVLLDTLRSRTSVARRVLCVCPPDEQHEVGLLIFAIDAATQGFEPIYLGANVPLADLTLAMQQARPELVATSLVLSRERSELEQLLIDMRGAVGPTCQLLVGGRALHGHADLVLDTGCVGMPDSGRLADLFPARQSRASTVS